MDSKWITRTQSFCAWNGPWFNSKLAP